MQVQGNHSVHEIGQGMKQRNTVAVTTSRNEWADNSLNRSGKSRFASRKIRRASPAICPCGYGLYIGIAPAREGFQPRCGRTGRQTFPHWHCQTVRGSEKSHRSIMGVPLGDTMLSKSLEPGEHAERLTTLNLTTGKDRSDSPLGQRCHVLMYARQR